MIATALIMGLAGSLHCVGMCSPLAMTVSRLSAAATVNRFIYNLGRILTYGLMGAVLGSAGMVIPFSGFQNLISILLGLSLLIVAVIGWQKVKIPGLTWILQGLNGRLKMLFGKYLQRKSYGAVFVLGTLNGILPCGLTFLALASSAAMGDPFEGAYFMILFGAGTLPVMLGLTGLLEGLVKRFNLSASRITTTMLVISGCLLIARVFFFHASHALPHEQSMVDMVLCR